MLGTCLNPCILCLQRDHFNAKKNKIMPMFFKSIKYANRLRFAQTVPCGVTGGVDEETGLPRTTTHQSPGFCNFTSTQHSLDYRSLVLLISHHTMGSWNYMTGTLWHWIDRIPLGGSPKLPAYDCCIPSTSTTQLADISPIQVALWAVWMKRGFGKALAFAVFCK